MTKLRWGLALLLLGGNALWDAKKQEIQPLLTGMMALLGVLLGLREEEMLLKYGPGVGLGLLLLGLSVIGQGAVGLGDGFLLMALGLWLPWEETLSSLLWGSLLSALAGGILLLRHHKREEPYFVRDPEGERKQNRHPDRISHEKTSFLEEPCFVLDPEGERLQNRHPDRVGRVKTAFLEERIPFAPFLLGGFLVMSLVKLSL